MNDNTIVSDFSYLIKTQGYYLLKNAIQNKELLARLSTEIDAACEKNSNNIEGYATKFYDIVHHLFDKGDSFIELFEEHPGLELIESILGETCIVHSFNAVKLMPGKNNNATKVHRDSPRFSPGYTLSLQVLYFVDRFTKENGATYLLPASQHLSDQPSDEQFNKYAVQMEGDAGDALLFDSAVWHAGGKNFTDKPRRGITVVYSRAFMKQQIDLPRSLSSIVDKLSQKAKRLIGMNVRVPSSVIEFNLPEAERLYKANQG